jgi:hypothetical protein
MFSETIKTYARKHAVGFGVLCELQFTTGTKYVHQAGGILSSRDTNGDLEDIQWLGLQGYATVTNLGASRVGAARQVNCTLKAEDEWIKEAFADQSREIKGRTFRFWGQFYDEDLTPLDPRFHLYTGTGDTISMQKSGPSSRIIALNLEDFFVRRKRSANSMVTNTDQQSRDPGSYGFIYVMKMVDQTLNLYDTNN